MKNVGMALGLAALLSMAGWAAPEPPAAAPAQVPLISELKTKADLAQWEVALAKIKATIAEWEAAAATARTDDSKAFYCEGIEKAKSLQSLIEKALAAFRAARYDEGKQLNDLVQAASAEIGLRIGLKSEYDQMDNVAALLAERGKDSPDLAAHCQNFLNLTRSRIELRGQLADVTLKLNKESQALRALAGTASKPGAPESGGIELNLK